MIAQPQHEALFQDLCQILQKYSGQLSAEEVLAIAANMLGKLIALQDQRTMTREKALKIITLNLEYGNKQVVNRVANSQGSA